ncbi:MAG: N-6 DNA methylase [Methylococcales bacterium]
MRDGPGARTFYGKEKMSLAYFIAIMNLILHGIETPNIPHTNTLAENLADIQDADRFDLVLTNPPFGGKERKEVQQNFPIRTANGLPVPAALHQNAQGRRVGVVFYERETRCD